MSIDHDARGKADLQQANGDAEDAGGTGYTVVSLERDGHVATLFLDRPDKRNTMGPAFFDELPSAMEALGTDDSVRAVVIAAKGPHFTVGLDLAALADIAAVEAAPTQPGGEAVGTRRPPSPARQAARTHTQVLRMQASITAVAECPKPVVAAVHGYCIGGGIDLISACDIRVCSADAIFSVRETKMAIVADLGTLQRLPLVLAMGQVAELVYTGKDIGAARAERIGLVNEVAASPEEALAAARGIAAEIAANPPLAVQGSKSVLSQIHRQQVADGLRYVAAWNAGQLRSHDLTEAVTAFLEKRPPTFDGG